MATKEELAWIAGMIDGDGWIGLLRDGKKQYFSNVMSIWSTNREALERIKDLIECGKVKKLNRYNHNHKNQYYITLYGESCINLLLKTREYLVTKREQCDLLLEYAEKCMSKERTVEMIDTRHAIYKDLKLLNKKGK